jgi:hypothetical protein
MKNILLGIAMSSLLLAACNNNEKTSTETKDTLANTTTESTAAKASATDAVTKDYLELKNALAEDNDQLAAEAGKSLVVSFGAIQKAS